MNLIQKYRPKGISVTDLSAQLWCEKQLWFSLERGRLKRKEMERGAERHKDLHEEIAILTKVEPKTDEDKVALMLHNTIIGIIRLLKQKITRELPTWGYINSLFIIGSIDELRIQNNNLCILDTKTRFNGKMPSIEQKRTSEFQLMLYKNLIDSIISKKFTYLNLLKFYNFSSKSRVTEDFQAQIIVSGNKIEANIEKLAKAAFLLLQQLPKTTNTLIIRYENQENGDLIGTHTFQFNPEKFQENCNFVEEFWLGKRGAIPVGEKNRWKCNFCEFKEECVKSRKF